MDQQPDREAYGRVTGAERFAVLHQAADAEIARLVATYAVERSDEPSPRDGTERVVQLTPDGGGAALRFTFTSFPGVGLKYGFAGDELFPACGCDACGEDPTDEALRMKEVVEAVTGGGLTEVRRRRWLRPDIYEHVLVHRDGQSWRARPVDGTAQREAAVPRGERQWPAWRRRDTPQPSGPVPGG